MRSWGSLGVKAQGLDERVFRGVSERCDRSPNVAPPTSTPVSRVEGVGFRVNGVGSRV